jgi:photosystem II stability/assembly factor-like uncharacterized protein
MQCIVACCAAALFLTGTSSLGAATLPHWRPVGPAGGQVDAIAIAPSAPEIAYAGSAAAGVFRSADGGASWVQLGGATPRVSATALVVSPRDPDLVYAATSLDGAVDGQGTGIYMTQDGGVTWAATVAPPGAQVAGFAVDPHDPSLVFAASSAGLLRARFGQRRWSVLWVPPVAAPVASLAIDPRRDATLYAGLAGPDHRGGLYKSTDSGRTWAAVGTGPQGFPMPDGAASLTFDPTDPKSLYAVDTLAGALYRSRDGARTWTNVGPAVDTPVVGLAIGPTGTLYAIMYGISVLRSVDHGHTWSAPASAGPADEVLGLAVPATAAGAGASESVLAAGLLGVWQSNDGALTWHPSSHGLLAQRVSSLLASPAALFLDLFSENGGVDFFQSRSHAQHWLQVAGSPFVVERLLAVDPQQPSTLYGSLPFAKTTDGGRTWTALVYAGQDPVTALAVDPTRSDVLYAAAPQVTIAGQHCTLGKSTDGGSSWTCFSTPGNGHQPLLLIDPDHPDTLYYADESGVWRSTDGAGTWSAADAGLPSGGGTGLALDPADTSMLYLVSTSGLFASGDGGASWHRQSSELPAGATGLLVDPRAPAQLYAAVAGTGVYRSTDGGATWSVVGGGLPVQLFSGVFALDPALPATLYAGTDGEGVFRIDLGR